MGGTVSNGLNPQSTHCQIGVARSAERMLVLLGDHTYGGSNPPRRLEME